MNKTRGRPKKTAITRHVGAEVLLNSLAVAELLGCGDRKAMQMMRNGELKSQKLGSVVFTTKSAVERYVAEMFKPEEAK
jgi:excisionase family DNA binding protein